LFCFCSHHAVMNLTLFIFAIIKFHLCHLSQRSSSAVPFNLDNYRYVLLLVQIVLPHFLYVQFECFLVPKIIVFVVTQIECIEFCCPSLLHLCSLHFY
jgi:hypothetical protein